MQHNKLWLRVAIKLKSMGLEEATMACVRGTIINGFWLVTEVQSHTLNNESANTLIDLCDMFLDNRDKDRG